MEQTKKMPRFEGSKGSVHHLVPVTISGVVLPCLEDGAANKEVRYKLACADGTEYMFVVDQKWRQVLRMHRWEEVQVKGLLNSASSALIPQKVFPKGPKGELEQILNLEDSTGRSLSRKWAARIRDFVLVPTALLAILV